MRKFALCDNCAREYGDPNDRRFHAEPTACPGCGPQLQLWNSLGEVVAAEDAALLQAAAEIRAGRIVAVKGLGGFQLLVNARDSRAVMRLRERKRRAEKPFATLFPSLSTIRAACVVSELEERLLRFAGSADRSAPAAGLRGSGRRPFRAWQPEPRRRCCLTRHCIIFSCGNLIFPSSPRAATLATNRFASRNTKRSNGYAESLIASSSTTGRSLGMWTIRSCASLRGRELVLRRARGYAPLPITLSSPTAEPILAARRAFEEHRRAAAWSETYFISQHIGDLATQPAHDAFIRSAADLPRLYERTPE